MKARQRQNISLSWNAYDTHNETSNVILFLIWDDSDANIQKYSGKYNLSAITNYICIHSNHQKKNLLVCKQTQVHHFLEYKSNDTA